MTRLCLTDRQWSLIEPHCLTRYILITSVDRRDQDGRNRSRLGRYCENCRFDQRQHGRAIGDHAKARGAQTLEQPELRRDCQAGLNKGEARHTLAAAIYTNRQGRFTDCILQNQEYRASGFNLLIAAIAYWNTIYLDQALPDYRRRV
jgi:Tn3 transposase DDE domain